MVRKRGGPVQVNINTNNSDNIGFAFSKNSDRTFLGFSVRETVNVLTSLNLLLTSYSAAKLWILVSRFSVTSAISRLENLPLTDSKPSKVIV